MHSTAKAAAARHGLATSHTVLAAGRATSGPCATAVMPADYGRLTLTGRADQVWIRCELPNQ
jgi:hypothetical protein